MISVLGTWLRLTFWLSIGHFGDVSRSLRGRPTLPRCVQGSCSVIERKSLDHILQIVSMLTDFCFLLLSVCCERRLEICHSVWASASCISVKFCFVCILRSYYQTHTNLDLLYIPNRVTLLCVMKFSPLTLVMVLTLKVTLLEAYVVSTASLRLAFAWYCFFCIF